jgi:hypothetical protein
MSKKNITNIKKNLPGGRIEVEFETRPGETLRYSYGPRAAKRIEKGADPVNFKSKKVK